MKLQWPRGVVVITTAQLHSTKPALKFCRGSNPACSMLKISDDEELYIVGKGGHHPPPFSRSTPFLEIQDVPTFQRFIRKTIVLNNSCNHFVYNFYPQFWKNVCKGGEIQTWYNAFMKRGLSFRERNMKL